LTYTILLLLVLLLYEIKILSTYDVLHNVTQYLYSNLDYSKKSIAIFLDLAKAFDSVNHEILLDILPSLGINNLSHNWFKCYLHNRKQTVKINEVNGSTHEIKNGVPQGSGLRPILCTIYINEICDINIEGLIVTYADETCLLFYINHGMGCIKQPAEVSV